MRPNKLLLSAFALSVGIATAGTGVASAHEDQPAPTPGAPVFFAAELTGRAEIPVAGGPAVGDPDGHATEVVRIQGNQVSFAIKWKNIGAPTAAHIHDGKAGVNGAVKVPFFGGVLPEGVNGAVGHVSVGDPALLKTFTDGSGAFYANLHTAEFPGGAVRGQFRKLDKAVDLNRVLHNGDLSALASGDQEVPGAGDPDGGATAFVETHRSSVDYSFTFSGVGSPTLGHIHQGDAGTSGPVVVPLFAAPGGLPASITGIAGTATKVPANVIRGIDRNPGGFYANLHTAEFPAGAVRGQLFEPGDDDSLY
ncbi:CHRD domain-containing protein [Amycolatopsis sp. H20-H5]|uniref:CHRD domain-containing protein n=1 Tax=Amycolatopsis sp. H20-H5 TaxID=3046309 RepID=UPI002DBB61CD|nr:CHRD domain-containing protein [Amycolatopsis sp. H20-H5]MEC3981168.1 CHRD domain-containing protein [Amycolatopsis sp. H20-H5]